ncbi:MAG: 4Fe-4S binding protein [Deltaproteobacteria bacterium]|nr:4Fe-4S binding protein [Deltaproteobacteria bacterium]MBW2323679.1 4Fe-4S binding protein [Deltaproteobacteria bacterium]
MWFKAYHEFGHGKSMDTSNYQAKFHPETCKGCGLCVKRCPMEAVRLVTTDEAKNKVGKIAVLEQDLCIGCGVCAFKCPTSSIVLERRDEITEPPADTREYVKRFIKDFANPLPRREIK